MRRRAFVKAIGGVVVGLVCYDPMAVSRESRKAWKHATGRKAYWVGRNGLWTEPVNWSNQRVPDENTDVVIGRDEVIIPAGTEVVIHSLTIQDDAVVRMDGNLSLVVRKTDRVNDGHH